MKPPQHNPDLTKDTVMQLHLSPMNVSQQIKRLRTHEIITSPGGKSMAVRNRLLTLSCEQAEPSLLTGYKEALEGYIRQCAAMAGPRRSFSDKIFGRNKPSIPAKCPNLNKEVFESLGIDIKSAGHLPCVKPADGREWKEKGEDQATASKALSDMRSKAAVNTAVILTKALIWGGERVGGRSSLNANGFFVIKSSKSFVFPHELGHRVGWISTPDSENIGPYHSTIDSNLMSLNGGGSVDCQWCELILKIAK